MMSKDKMLMAYSITQLIMSSWICRLIDVSRALQSQKIIEMGTQKNK
jgi:hypothetical protein